MALTKEQKSEIIEQVKGKLEQYPIVYLTNCSGLSVEGVQDLRGKFREAQVEYQVVKNTLLKRAMDGVGGFEGLYEYLEGPTAVALSEEPAAPARVMKKFLDDSSGDLPALKAAFVDGAVYDSSALAQLATLKSKDELIGEIIGLLTSPVANVVSALQSQGTTLAAAIKTISERDA